MAVNYRDQDNFEIFFEHCRLHNLNAEKYFDVLKNVQEEAPERLNDLHNYLVPASHKKYSDFDLWGTRLKTSRPEVRKAICLWFGINKGLNQGFSYG